MTNDEHESGLPSIDGVAGARILVVDDGKTNRDLISLVLINAHAQVTCAENGEEALKTYEAGEIDIILMDMQMPIMDGYSATRNLREKGCTLPIIALTANAMRGDRNKCLSAGCTDFLTKPINIDSLLQTVSLHLPDQKGTFKPPVSLEQEQELDSCCEPSRELAADELSPILSDLPTEIPQLREIVEDFIKRLQSTKIEEMQTALGSSNWSELAELAHWLKGTGGTAGFNCLSESALQLELAAKEQEKKVATLLLVELTKMSQRLSVNKNESDNVQTIQ